MWVVSDSDRTPELGFEGVGFASEETLIRKCCLLSALLHQKCYLRHSLLHEKCYRTKAGGLVDSCGKLFARVLGIDQA